MAVFTVDFKALDSFLSRKREIIIRVISRSKWRTCSSTRAILISLSSNTSWSTLSRTRVTYIKNFFAISFITRVCSAIGIRCCLLLVCAPTCPAALGKGWYPGEAGLFSLGVKGWATTKVGTATNAISNLSFMSIPFISKINCICRGWDNNFHCSPLQ